MVFVLKSEGPGKGILLLKHLEYKYFSGLNRSLIKELRSRYIVGVYYGYYHDRAVGVDYIDFTMAAEGVIGSPVKGQRVFLNGFNFIADSFGSHLQRKSVAKSYDYLFIGNYHKRKGLMDFLDAFNCLARRGDPISGVCIVRCTDDDHRSKLRKQASVLLKRILQFQNAKLTFIEINDTRGTVLPAQHVELFIKQSRSVVVPSWKEGAARVVAEAEICGTPVVLRGSCKGGSGAFLVPEENVVFAEDTPLAEAMSLVINDPKTAYANKKPNERPYKEKFSKDTLFNFLENKFDFRRSDLAPEDKDISFYNAISSHISRIEAKYTNLKTDEIYSFYKFNLYLSHLVGRDPGPSLRLRVLDLVDSVKRSARGRLVQVLGYR